MSLKLKRAELLHEERKRDPMLLVGHAFGGQAIHVHVRVTGIWMMPTGSGNNRQVARINIALGATTNSS